MRKTNAFEKLIPSVLNVFFAFIIFLPFYFSITNSFTKKLVFIGIFFCYNLIFLIFNDNKCLGMIIMKTNYAKKYSKLQHFLYSILYTLSFSTLLFWIFFPFDLFLFNMLVLQLPIIILKKTTLHGYLSGNITTVRGH
ncbi:hypothetical protein HOC80_04790 [archaeon]|jgi:hypothetical protein|nr:hypothetical protein [archaeon]MBT4417390.1 hypothetical protein [archaeon]